MFNVKIFTPLLYLRLENKFLNLYTWKIPLFFSILIVMGIIFLPIKVNIFNLNGVIESINQLLSILVGFYIGSLAAIEPPRVYRRPVCLSYAALGILSSAA